MSKHNYGRKGLLILIADRGEPAQPANDREHIQVEIDQDLVSASG